MFLGTLRPCSLLTVTRNPQNPSGVHHSYDDKYLLAEIATQTSLAALVNCLEVLGITNLNKLKEWSTTKTLTLSFKSTERFAILTPQLTDQMFFC